MSQVAVRKRKNLGLLFGCVAQIGLRGPSAVVEVSKPGTCVFGVDNRLPEDDVGKSVRPNGARVVKLGVSGQSGCYLPANGVPVSIDGHATGSDYFGKGGLDGF